MERWRCTVCGCVYDPSKVDPIGGITDETPFELLPDEWVCPICGVTKDLFENI